LGALLDMRWLEYINPLNHYSNEEYVHYWDALFRTTLAGIFPRFAFVAAVIGAFWYGVRRQNWAAARTLLFVAGLMAYGGAILMALGVM